MTLWRSNRIRVSFLRRSSGRDWSKVVAPFRLPFDHHFSDQLTVIEFVVGENPLLMDGYIHRYILSCPIYIQFNGNAAKGSLGRIFPTCELAVTCRASSSSQSVLNIPTESILLNLIIAPCVVVSAGPVERNSMSNSICSCDKFIPSCWLLSSLLTSSSAYQHVPDFRLSVNLNCSIDVRIITEITQTKTVRFN